MEPHQDPCNPSQTEAFFRRKTLDHQITLAAQFGSQTVLATCRMRGPKPEMGQEQQFRVAQGAGDLVYPPCGFERTFGIRPE